MTVVVLATQIVSAFCALDSTRNKRKEHIEFHSKCFGLMSFEGHTRNDGLSFLPRIHSQCAVIEVCKCPAINRYTLTTARYNKHSGASVEHQKNLVYLDYYHNCALRKTGNRDALDSGERESKAILARLFLRFRLVYTWAPQTKEKRRQQTIESFTVGTSSCGVSKLDTTAAQTRTNCNGFVS